MVSFSYQNSCVYAYNKCRDNLSFNQPKLVNQHHHSRLILVNDDILINVDSHR